MVAMLVGSSMTQMRRWLRVGAGAVAAGIDVGDVVADGAEAEMFLDLADGVREVVRVGGGRAEDVKGEALRGLGADAGELAQLLDQAGHGFGEAGGRHG